MRPGALYCTWRTGSRQMGCWEMIDWSRADTVLLDMDGTLLDLAFDNRFWLEDLPGAHAASRGWPLARATADLTRRMRAVEGTIEWYCLDYWSEQLGFDVMALKYARRDDIGYRPGARAFLEAVGGSGHRRLLVTNAHRSVLDLKLEVTGLDAYLDDIVSAHDYGIAKQSRGFWDRLHRTTPFDPDAAVLLDDSHAVLRAARDWGVAQVFGIARPDTGGPALSAADLMLIDEFEAVAPGTRVPAGWHGALR